MTLCARAGLLAALWFGMQRPASCPPWLMSPATPRYECGPWGAERNWVQQDLRRAAQGWSLRCLQAGCKYKWFPDSTGTVKRYVSSNPPLSRLHTRIRWTTPVKEEVNMLELRPVHLVRNVETETRCTSDRHRSDVDCASFLLLYLYRWCKIFYKTSTAKPLVLVVSWPFAKEMCLSLGTIPYNNFQCLTCCRRTATGVQTGRHCPCIQVRRSGNSQPATIDQFLSFPSWASFLRKCVNAAQNLSGQQQSSSWNPVSLPCQTLNWRCPCIYCESLTAGERLWKGNQLSLCIPKQGVW